MTPSVERIRIYDGQLPYPPAPVSVRSTSSRVARATNANAPFLRVPAASAPQPVDGLYATAVLSPTRLLATFYWGRAMYYGKPLILLDFTVAPLLADSWTTMDLCLRKLLVSRRCRHGRLGCFVEGDHLAHAARGFVTDALSVPAHLVKTDQWHVLCQSAANYLAAGSVGYTKEAADKMDERPFIDAAGVYAGPRTEDPTVPAFLYGIVIGLDPVAARDPNAKPPVRARR